MNFAAWAVPNGYKHTEVGVIPKDWHVLPISRFASTKTGPFGTLLKASEYCEHEGVPMISVGEIREGYLRICDDTPRIPEHIIRRLPQFVLHHGDIVFGRKGGVERSALIGANEEGWFLGSDGICVRPSSQMSAEYLAFQFRSARIKSWLLKHAIGTTMPSLNQEILGNLTIPLAPTLAEQEAIAEALGDADALIASLEQLVAKKRHLKQAAMQQLLTGKTRLPGFEGEWKTDVLSEHLRMPVTYGIVKAGEFQQAGIPMVRGGDIKEGRIGDGLPFVAHSKSEEYRRTILEENDIVIALVGYPGEAAKVPPKYVGANISRAVGLLRMGDTLHVDYLVSYLNSPMGRRIVLAPSAGSAQVVVNLREINKLEFPFPPTHDEQSAIAEVLDCMASEIEAIEAKLAKARQIKKGMMQELLTGKTRLIEPETTA